MIKRYDISLHLIAYDGARIDKDEYETGEWVKYEDNEREVRELERRVLWLERKLTAKDSCSGSCCFCGSTQGHEETCSVFYSNGRVKPTPEDFK